MLFMVRLRLVSNRPRSHVTTRNISSNPPLAQFNRSTDPESLHSTTPQARKLRSIISLYHSAEHFAPLNDNERLIRFIDDSLLFKKGPTQYSPPNSFNVLSSTIRTLGLGQPILRPGESEQDLNPIMASQRIRAGQARWRALKDALCGSSASDTIDEPSPRAGLSRFGSKFGSADLPGTSQTGGTGGKAGLEIVEDHWAQIKEIEKMD